ncbi:MAG: CPBP family intramembrane metalloprotease [Balneolaceae bacterium]|nr:MAG: CPBP family intramembrane metalloprotease [Balneolaceae bacterium]
MKNIVLILDFCVLFLALPLLVFFEILQLPKLLILLLCTMYCMYVLWKDPEFERKMLWNFDGLKNHYKQILIRAAFAMVFMSIIFALFEPEELFVFIIDKPLTWLLIIILYPLLSVLPQELIYRAYIFHRYRFLFGSGRLQVHLSALAFAFVHIIYFNYPAVFLTYGAGYLFARTYKETKSLLAVSLEHAVYGCFIFTIGLGKYFYIS